MLLAALPALAGPVSFTDTGVWQLRAPGLPNADGSLFLWHGSWKYAVPQQVAAKDGVVSGWLPASAAGARVSFTARAYPMPDGMSVAYTFHRDAGAELTRGIFTLLQLPLEPLAKRAIRFASSNPQRAGTMFQGAGRSCSVNLSDTQALRVQVDRVTTFERRRDQANAVAINVLLLPADFAADTDVPVTVTIRLEPAGSEKMPWQTDSHEPLAIRGARMAVPMVPVNGTATVEVDLTGTFDNPFDPEQIALDAEITAPDGRLLRVPGYFQQEFLASRESGMELLSPRGEPYWRVRFTPTLPGRYRVLLRARDKTGEVTFGPVEAGATAADLPGMVRIGRFRNCFVREGGKSIFLIGHNVPTYLTGAQGMADCFDKMAAGGENYTRLWMYSAHLGLEWGQPVGTYRLDEAWRLDHAFELARQRGMVILLCMDTHQDFLGGSMHANPYNQASGGPIAPTWWPGSSSTRSRAGAATRATSRASSSSPTGTATWPPTCAASTPIATPSPRVAGPPRGIRRCGTPLASTSCRATTMPTLGWTWPNAPPRSAPTSAPPTPAGSTCSAKWASTPTSPRAPATTRTPPACTSTSSPGRR
ncbi:MAG: DUF5060 domain-containing protein [Armatimonadetes bacterium]|nr:DUF5060 domain-containing protein [Armatimonadota bacterium]